ncbi:monosaccharide ABC transporter membrane protein (CUT2 family) [Mobilisporobacter senegalensis]|uniref:Monosaccharide ABC transporter membrane protein (CUT2 family) n=1 Tax=Mobilisporobacter senegalensis TaxID=1329262 RepID=A0A3N1XVS8_9FIRM|nr:ABC transporter permease [Mobilisporobacter senegalensis]ROR30696.1 monosaccharide ABC transporter membrane protein (CUT2 family) [Mobilisporobacter senegalensis]
MNNSKQKNNSAIIMTLLKGRTLIVLGILVVFFSIATPTFLTTSSLLLIAKHVALYGILGIGMTYVIITGGIDLSVGAIVGLGGMIAGGLINEGLTLKMFGVTVYFSVPAIVIITMICGALIGILNGLVITKFNVAPFIATLGMMYVARGFAMLRSNGATFSNLTGKEGLGNTGFEFFGRNIGGIPVGAIILLIIAVIAAILLKKTSFGWHILAIGGNEKAAKLSGVKVNKVKILVYMFSGICAAIVGIITASQLVAAHPASGESWEMNAIAATVLGGTSMSGGVGTIGGTIIGAFVIGVINDGLVMCGVSEFWQMVIKGLVIVFAVVIDQFQRNLQAKMALQSRNENS